MKTRSHQNLVRDLRELLAALDRRIPRIEREGERAIARDAQDNFRNWLALGLQPAKGHENQGAGQNGTGGSGEIESSQWSRRGRATV